MNTTENVLVQKIIKSRISIALVISILLSSALASLYQLSGGYAVASNYAFFGTLVPALYIIGYVFSEIFSKRIAHFMLVIINKVVLVGVGMFSFPIILVSFYQNGKDLGFFLKILLYISTWIIPLVAILIPVSFVVAYFVSRKK